MRLVQAISERMDELGIDMTRLAAKLDVNPSQVSRLLDGTTKEVTLERVRQLEQALELDTGELLIAAGYVRAQQTLRQAIAGDASLSAPQRKILRDLLRTWE